MAAMLASEPVIIHSEALGFNADCAEFCPHPGLNYLLALGTYQLVEETQERVGRCYLRALQLGGAGDQPQGSINAGSLDMPGIFDLKWRPTACDAQNAILGAALADGTVRLMEVVAVSENAAVETLPELRLQSQVAACSSGMCLSLDWQVGYGSVEARIATSSSAGTLSLLQATNTELSHVCEWKAHELEAWCTAFHKAEVRLLLKHLFRFAGRAFPEQPLRIIDKRRKTFFSPVRMTVTLRLMIYGPTPPRLSSPTDGRTQPAFARCHRTQRSNTLSLLAVMMNTCGFGICETPPNLSSSHSSTPAAAIGGCAGTPMMYTSSWRPACTMDSLCCVVAPATSGAWPWFPCTRAQTNT
ncbi:hypothetical protein Vretifemale_2002 [Volvox reticuliferus]|nr:hypothetical protein Vretifemale_2002 [Volvox reticuliferus]